ncbi:MAG: CDP-alcohol phosphatidyltransferase family protein [Gammaproteobacteria bacterium]
MQSNKPWDARLAFWFIYPLRDSRLTPNHITSLRLLSGVWAGLSFALGDNFWSNVGAFSFVLSNFLDHADGEFARLTGKGSRTGHYFDLLCDAIVNILLFIGIGIGLAQSSLGSYALPMGCIVGLSVAATFHMRLQIEEGLGKVQCRQPNLGCMEAEDVLYLLPLITLTQLLVPFFVLASIGAPLFMLWVLKDYLVFKNKPSV